jgi:ABC-type transport system involved in multi-copper enzyme maturation permease subunit
MAVSSMFNPAIFLKTLRDAGLLICLAALGMIGFQVLFVWGMLTMGTELLDFVSKLPFLAKIFEVALGIKVEGEVSLGILFSISFTHGIVLMLSWSVIIAIATGVTVGEIERGTADMLLTLPVSRPEVYVSTTGVWLLAAGMLSLSPLLGMSIALACFETKEVVSLSQYIPPALNFLALNMSIGALATMVSCFLDRRGVAIGAIAGIALCSVVLNFIEPFISGIKQIQFLGLLNYFRPVDVVRTGVWPIGNIVVLLSLFAICWTIGLVTYSRRDIPTA